MLLLYQLSNIIPRYKPFSDIRLIQGDTPSPLVSLVDCTHSLEVSFFAKVEQNDPYFAHFPPPAHALSQNRGWYVKKSSFVCLPESSAQIFTSPITVYTSACREPPLTSHLYLENIHSLSDFRPFLGSGDFKALFPDICPTDTLIGLLSWLYALHRFGSCSK